ncbi:MAG: hypothetical protein ACRDHZ_18300, partial [Ktedonobacteraceae bacterium]
MKRSAAYGIHREGVVFPCESRDACLPRLIHAIPKRKDGAIPFVCSNSTAREPVTFGIANRASDVHDREWH